MILPESTFGQRPVRSKWRSAHSRIIATVNGGRDEARCCFLALRGRAPNLPRDLWRFAFTLIIMAEPPLSNPPGFPLRQASSWSFLTREPNPQVSPPFQHLPRRIMPGDAHDAAAGVGCGA